MSPLSPYVTPQRPSPTASVSPRPAVRLACRTAATALLLVPAAAHAGTTGGGGLAWETPLQTIATSLTGPVAALISLMAITVSGGMLIWGGELNEFARRMIMVVLVMSLIVFASSILMSLFGVGATVTAGHGGSHTLAAFVASTLAALGVWGVRRWSRGRAAGMGPQAAAAEA